MQLCFSGFQMDCSRLGLLHHVACPSYKELLVLEILFWLMLLTFWFWIIHQEEVPRNLDHDIGLWAAGLHTPASGSFWFPICIFRTCWLQTLGKSTGIMELWNKIKNTQNQQPHSRKIKTPQSAGLPWRLPLAKNLMEWLTNSCYLAFFRLPSALAWVLWIPASYSVWL